MVQSPDQYKFVYATLKDTFLDRMKHRPVGSAEMRRERKLQLARDGSLSSSVVS